MALHVHNSGSFQQVQDVWIHNGGSFARSKEVYINKDGTWKPVLFQSQTQSFSSTGTVDVPVGAFRATVTISGASGGRGGFDASSGPGYGGPGATVTAMFEVLPFTTLSFTIGQVGGNGTSSAGNAAGGTGGNGANAGGTGGKAGPSGSSGGGGGGGGSSSVALPSSTVIMLAAGGGGGGGAGNRRHLSQSNLDGKSSTAVATTFSPAVGGAGTDCPCYDGGAGGGGGAGSGGGAGGLYYTAGSVCQITPGCVGNAYDNDGFGGNGGTSYYHPDLVSAEPLYSTNTGTGSITFTWLKEEGY